MRTSLLLIASLLAGCSGAGAASAPADSVAPPVDPTLRAINDDYLASAKPLFARACASCHGPGNALPWYHAIPFVRGMIDDDIARARRTMDMSHDFPFRGRGTPAEYLEAIGEVLDEGSMPPLRYRALHWAAGFDTPEKDIVREWVGRSLLRLDE